MIWKMKFWKGRIQESADDKKACDTEGDKNTNRNTGGKDKKMVKKSSHQMDRRNQRDKRWMKGKWRKKQ